MKPDTFSPDFLQKLIGVLPVGLMVLDEKLRIVFRNEKAVSVSELPASNWEPGTDIRDLLAIGFEFGVYRDHNSLDELMAFLFENMNTTGVSNTIRYQPNGKIISETFEKIPSGGYVGIYSDITELKESEHRLQNLSIELKEKTKAAEAAKDAKSDFLANMSHEIRTPMSGVLGMAEILIGTDLDEKQLNYANIIHHSGSMLLNIIDDILDYSKLEASKLELEKLPIDLRQIVSSVGDLLGGAARKKHIDLITYFQKDLPNEILGDEGRIRQILVNLVGNAIKFTAKGYVIVTVTGKATNGVFNLNLSVADSGPGIEKRRQDDIFEQFSQADSSITRKYGGSGLGLTITRRLVEAMDGDIEVKSQIGKGSVFSIDVKLPIAKQDGKLPRNRAFLTGQPILIVDDLTVNRKVLATYVQSWGGTPICKQNEYEALEELKRAKYEQRPIELVITDFNVADVNGLQLVEEIRSDTDLNHIGCIVLAATDDISADKKFSDLGVDAYLLKPFRERELRDTVFEALNCGCIIPITRDVESIEKSPPVQKQISETKRQVLVAEDIELNRIVMENLLDRPDTELTFAINGRQACEYFQDKDFDLILMDISMPIMNGMEATKAIREIEQTQGLKETPIIAVTAHAFESDRCLYTSVGMNDFIAKPLELKPFKIMIKKWIAVKHSQLRNIA